MSVLRGIAGLAKNAVGARLPSMLGVLVTHRRDVVGGLVAAIAIALIVANGLFMQSGPHPAPIFARRHRSRKRRNPNRSRRPCRCRRVPARSRRLPPIPTRSRTSSNNNRIR
jgi:hypothetical protein